MSWYLKVLKNYAVFQGRARRKEYWMFVLFNVLISIALIILGNILGLGSESGTNILYLLYSLAIILPSLAVSVRRLHDTGRSGWWLLISLIPLIGGIVVLVFTVQDSEPSANEYGPNPKLEEGGFAHSPA